MPKALVVGGGIAGPAVAQFLTQLGWEARVFEARPAPDPYEGLFLNLAVNGRAVLGSLGVAASLLEDAHPAASMVMWSRTGKRLGVVPNGPVGREGDGGVIVRRGWLHEVVRHGAEVAGVQVEFDSRLAAIDEDPGGVTATFAGGRRERGDILIGADGIGSVVRERVAPGVAPTFTGLVGTGGFGNVPGLGPTPGVQHFVFGARSFFGYLVRDDGTVYWFANLGADRAPEPDQARLSGGGLLARLRDLHRDDPEPVPQILANASDDPVGYPIFSLPSVPTWSAGRVVALGDAVHATSPSAGQGASMALEDAAVLAACLGEHRSHVEAFAAYQRERQARVEQILAYAARLDRHKRVATGRIQVAIRDAVLPMFLRRAAHDDRNNWIFDYRTPLPR